MKLTLRPAAVDNSIGAGTLGRGQWAGLTPQLPSSSMLSAVAKGSVVTTPIAARRLELRLTMLVGGGGGGGGSVSVVVSGPTAKGGDSSLRSLPITRSLADEPVEWQQPKGDGSLNTTRLPLLWQGEMLTLTFTLMGNVTLFAFSL